MSEESPGQAAGEQGARGHDWDVPWIEAIGADRPERAQLAAQFGEGFRKTGSLMQLMGQAAADRIGLNATDLNCLNILSFSGELTAGDLARETGLTTASITGVADRLEEAGYVRRERDPKDRRRVVIRLVLESALRDVAPVFLMAATNPIASSARSGPQASMSSPAGHGNSQCASAGMLRLPIN